MFRSARRLKQPVPPRTSLAFAVMQRLILAVVEGVLCRVSLARRVKLDPAWSGHSCPMVMVAPAGTDPTKILGTLMQATLGSVDCRTKLAPVKAGPVFSILTVTSPVSPVSGKG